MEETNLNKIIEVLVNVHVLKQKKIALYSYYKERNEVLTYT